MEVEPSHGSPFVGVFWRAWVITIVGGGVVGMSTGLAFALFDDDSELIAIPGVGLVGAMFGVLFGFLPAFVLAGFVTVVVASPRSPARIVELTRWAAAGVIAVLIAWLASGLGFSAAMAMTFFPAVALAWLSAPWTVRWFTGLRD